MGVEIRRRTKNLMGIKKRRWTKNWMDFKKAKPTLRYYSCYRKRLASSQTKFPRKRLNFPPIKNAYRQSEFSRTIKHSIQLTNNKPTASYRNVKW